VETTLANLLAVISIPGKITRTMSQAVGILLRKDTAAPRVLSPHPHALSVSLEALSRTEITLG